MTILSLHDDEEEDDAKLLVDDDRNAMSPLVTDV